MFGSTTLDVLIGLVVIFFLLSVACSAVVEFIAGLRDWRSKNLKTALCQMLGKQDIANSALQQFLGHPLVRPSARMVRTRQPGGTTVDVLWPPSYLAAQVFADVMIDLLGKSPVGVSYQQFRRIVMAQRLTAGNLPIASTTTATIAYPLQPSLRTALESLAQTVEREVPDGDGADAQRLVVLRGQIERWYDQTMARAGGWYKRRVQGWLLVVSTIVVTAMAVDAIAIAQYLMHAPNARQALTAMADRQVSASQPDVADTLKKLKEVSTSDVPMGWTAVGAAWKRADSPTSFVLLKLAGMLVTIFGVSLGAPFWFDVLNKVSNLRAAGTKPPESLATQAASNPAAALAAVDVAAAAGACPGASAGAATSSDASGAATLVVGGGGASATVPVPPALPGDYWSQEGRTRDRKAFDPTAKDFSLNNAAFLAKAALLAYRPKESVSVVADLWFPPAESPAIDGGRLRFLDRGDTQGFIAGDKDMILVSFRGTEPSRLQDIISDARIAWAQAYDGRVHSGFLGALRLVLEDAMAHVKKIRDNSQPIWVTGHSLGAALATLFAAEVKQSADAEVKQDPQLKEKVMNVAGLYTFGSPRVGDAAFVKARNAPATWFRFANGEDIVTRVAPRSFGYEHVGVFRYIAPNGTLYEENDWWLRFLNTVIDAMNDFKRAAQTSVKDHAMELYVKKLENLAAATA